MLYVHPNPFFFPLIILLTSTLSTSYYLPNACFPSNIMVSTLPPVNIFYGNIQLILYPFNLCCAKFIPTDNNVGNVGGIDVDNISR